MLEQSPSHQSEISLQEMVSVKMSESGTFESPLPSLSQPQKEEQQEALAVNVIARNIDFDNYAIHHDKSIR